MMDCLNDNKKAGEPISNNREIRELVAYLKHIWNLKIRIALSSFLLMVLALGFSFGLPDVYKSRVVIAPTNDSMGSSQSNLLGGVGSLASAVGINVGGGDVSQVDIALAILRSRAFLDEFFKKHELYAQYLVEVNWGGSYENEYRHLLSDKQNGQSIFLGLSRQRTQELKLKAYKNFVDKLEVVKSKKTNLITVSLSHYSPLEAQKVLALLMSDLDERIRQQRIERLDQSIKYLMENEAETPVARMKTVFYSLIEEQTKAKMLAFIQDEYLLQTIDPPFEPVNKSEPRRLLISMCGLLFGLFGALIFFSLKWLFSRY